MKKALRLALLAVLILYIAAVRPSNDRPWSADQRVLAHVADFISNVRIEHVRAFDQHAGAPPVPRYVDEEFKLADVQRAWFLVEPFSDRWTGLAHTLVSFERRQGDPIAVSVEIRKEEGETYSPLRGLFRRYELMYVIAKESDVIRLRTDRRRHDVYLYPVRATPEQVQLLFTDMMRRALRLETSPEFYNTLTNTCMTNIVRHVRRIAPQRVPRSWKVLLPGYSDRLAYEVGLIDTSAPFEEVRRRHWITGRAPSCPDDADFSRCIRQDLSDR